MACWEGILNSFEFRMACRESILNPFEFRMACREGILNSFEFRMRCRGNILNSFELRDGYVSTWFLLVSCSRLFPAMVVLLGSYLFFLYARCICMPKAVKAMKALKATKTAAAPVPAKKVVNEL